MDKSETKGLLINELMKISEDRDFHLAVINHINKDEDRLKLAEFIKNNPNTSYEEIILISLEIHEKQTS